MIKKINKKFLLLGLIFILLISSVQAVTYNSINGLATDSEFRRLTQDIAITWSGASQITSVNGYGITQNLSISYPKQIVEECVQDIIDPRICYYAIGNNLWTINFDTMTYNSTVINTNVNRTNFRIHSKTSNEWFFTYYDGIDYEWLVSKSLGVDNTANYTLPDGVPEMSRKYITNYKISPTFTTYDATNGYNFWEVFYKTDTDTLSVGVYYNNDTGTESFGYSNILTRTGFCYNKEQNTTRNFQNSDFPSNLFSNYGYQSEVLIIKPSCRYYIELYVDDLQNVTGKEFPNSYTRDGNPIGQPILHYPSGSRIGAKGLDTSYYQDEIFINSTHTFVDFYRQDLWLNEQNPIYAYNLDETTYYAGFSDNIYATFPLSSGTLIYPTGLYDYTIAKNLSTLTAQEPTVNLQDVIQTTGNNIGLQYGTDYITYILSNSGANTLISTINTNDNTDLSITNEYNIYNGSTPISIDGAGQRSDLVPSTNWNTLLVATETNITQIRDYDLFPAITFYNYTTSTDTIKSIMWTGSDGLVNDILTLRDSGTTVNIDLGVGTNSYPETTYTALKSSKFAPLDLSYSCISGSDRIFFATAISPSGTGLGICWFDPDDISPLILCDSSPQQITQTAYPFSSKVSGVSAYGQHVTSYYNSSSVINNHLTTCSTGSGITLQSICTIPSESGNVRSMFRMNSSHSLIGTTLGRIGLCDVNSGNVTIADLGTISAENETILQFESRNAECSGSGCDETLDNFHFITDKYYATAKVSDGSQAVPNFCGDLTCSGGESAFSCPVDCSATCGDSFCTHSEDSLSCPVDCGGAFCGNGYCDGGENVTTCPADCSPIWVKLPSPVEPPVEFNNTELQTLEVPSSDGILVGLTSNGQSKITKADFSDYLTFNGLSTINLLDFPYASSLKNGVLFVATDNEIHSVSGYTSDNLVLIERMDWNFPQPDIANDIQAINGSSAFVCHNYNEPDYYVISQDPDGNVAGNCQAMEYDETNEILFVDGNGEGIRVWETTDKQNLILNNTIDFRTGDLDLTGDIMDLKNDVLLVIKGTQTMSAYNVSDPYNPSLITVCNNGGLGQFISVEIYDETLALGGTTTGRLSLCNLLDNDEENNTDSFAIDEFESEEIRGIELDENNTVIMLTPTRLGAYILNNTQVLNNTPPNITSTSVSVTSAFISQPIDVQIIAGNIEPEDVVKYGVKCEGTESEFLQNSNGEFTCTYNSSGVYNLRMAVSDNYHVGSWFDERVQEIVIGEEVFDGGILRIQVLDEEQYAIENAQVTVLGEDKNTTAYGDVTFTTEDDGLYEVTTQKVGYYPSVDNFYADSSIHIVTLNLEPTGNETILQVTVVNKNGQKVENAIVSFTNTITYDYDYTFTNGLGIALFRGLDAGSVVVAVSKGDDSNSQSTNIATNNVNELEIVIDVDTLPNLHLDRDCVDDGIWLCGDVETECTQNSDCLSDQCTVGINKCSRFNYSVCDVNGYARGQSCVIKFSADQTLGNVTDWILDNLLWVIMLLIVVIGVGFIFVSWTPHRR